MRPIETRREDWITIKEAASLRGRHELTVRTWVRLSLVRSWREPGGRLLVFRPDIVPPVTDDPGARA